MSNEPIVKTVQPVDMREHIKEASELAHTYAVDGAYHSALRVLRNLTLDVQMHCERLKAFEEERITKYMKDHKRAR